MDILERFEFLKSLPRLGRATVADVEAWLATDAGKNDPNWAGLTPAEIKAKVEAAP